MVIFCKFFRLESIFHEMEAGKPDTYFVDRYPITGRCDNSFSRLPVDEFIQKFGQFCSRIVQICEVYLGRSLDAIVFHALVDFKKKHRDLAMNANDILEELVADVTVRLEGFLTEVRQLRITVARMSAIASHTGPASFLEKLSVNPLSAHILSQMGSKTMMVGGRMTKFKEFFGQQCWSDEKLTDFFTRLGVHLTQTFNGFAVVSTSQIELEGQLIDLRVQLLQDQELWKEKELSPVAMVIKEVLLDIKMEKLRALTKKTPNVRGA